jgi:hypothetical protein
VVFSRRHNHKELIGWKDIERSAVFVRNKDLNYKIQVVDD